MACLRSLVLGMLVAACAGLVSAQDCQYKKLYRLIVLQKYNDPNLNLTAIALSERNALQGCKDTFVRGVVGPDLGLGSSLFGPDAAPNWDVAKVLDFTDIKYVQDYYRCFGAVNVLPPKEAVQVIIKVPSCKSAGVSAKYQHIYLYNITTKPNDPAALLKVKATANACIAGIKCLYTNNNGGPDVGWESLLEQYAQPAPFMAYGGSVEMSMINYIRSYWSFLEGPPKLPQFTLLSSMMDGSQRIQIDVMQAK